MWRPSRHCFGVKKWQERRVGRKERRKEEEKLGFERRERERERERTKGL